MVNGDLCAEIIKVEATCGSDKTWKKGTTLKKNVSAYYITANRNKKSITVDLKSDESVEVIKRLASESDVIIHNFKTGTMERFGLGYSTLYELNPRKIGRAHV